MDAFQFAYWLQGFAELNNQPPSPEQWQSIREHLATVFKKVTPNPGGKNFIQSESATSSWTPNIQPIC